MDSEARADEGVGLRLGMSGGLGLLVAPGNGSVTNPAGEEQDFFAGGIGIDGRLGVQLGPHVAIDLQLLGESMLLAGDMRAGLLFEIAPIPQFAFALGGGVGTMFIANIFFHSPSADFGSGVVRLEGRLPQTYPGTDIDLVFGLEGQLGYVFKGSIPEGSLVVGARGFGGMLWH